METNTEIVNFISSSLDSENYKEALAALSDDKYKLRFNDYCWEVVATALAKIKDDTMICKPSLYGACENILFFVLGKCKSNDAHLEFLEQLELSKNDAQFGLVLSVVQKLLNKLNASKKRSLQWCLLAINRHIEKIKITEHNLDGDERKLIDSDPNVRRVHKVYTMVTQFYQPLLADTAPPGRKPNYIVAPIMVEFFIGLLGRPILYLDVDPNVNEKSEARLACATIINDIYKLEKNMLKFLEKLNTLEKLRLRCTDGSDQILAYDHTNILNLSTYSGFHYIIFSGHFELPDGSIPQVYSNIYLIHNLFIAVNHLLRYTEYGPQSKALALYKALNIRLAKHTSHELLSSVVHYNLLKRLVHVAIYSNYQSLRKIALESIGAHINKFDYKGRCALIRYLIGTSNHSGIIGYAITLYKDSVIEAFKEPILNECFTGNKLSSMIKTMCYLQHGAESDLIELADQIITTLNFLRFLVLKDKDNVTGIKDLIPILETEYLDVLVTALKMSKAHYELKLKDISEGTDVSTVSLSIAGNVLDSIPQERKKQIVESALNGFHLMEGLLARLQECIKTTNEPTSSV